MNLKHNYDNFLFTAMSGTFIAILVFSGCKIAKPTVSSVIKCDPNEISYTTKVKPIITESCTNKGCHTANGRLPDLSNYSGVKALVESGKFYQRVIENQSMPPGAPLKDKEIQILRCWIKQGNPNN